MIEPILREQKGPEDLLDPFLTSAGIDTHGNQGSGNKNSTPSFQEMMLNLFGTQKGEGQGAKSKKVESSEEGESIQEQYNDSQNGKCCYCALSEACEAW